MLHRSRRIDDVDSSQPKGSYWLVGLAGNARRVRLSAEGPLLVGRGAHNHLVLNDYRISRQHSRVAHERDGFVVYDLNSSNGTFVNGVAVRRQQIKQDDEVRFGPHGFRVEFHTEFAATADTVNPVKWRPTESITKFHQVNQLMPTSQVPHLPPSGVPASQVPPSQQVPRHETTGNMLDTIPPEGVFVEEVTDYHDPSVGDGPPASRESAKFRAELATVDLNQLEDAYEKLGTMYGFMQAISKTIDKQELLELIAGKILEIYPASRSVGIYLRDRSVAVPGQPLDHGAFHLIHFAGAHESERAPTLHEVTSNAVLRARRAIFTAGAPATMTTGRTMYAPMIDREDALGVIYVSSGGSTHRSFTMGDLELLNGIAVPAAIMLQNTRMHEESIQRERLNRDLELAAQIQKSFLPREVLSVPGVEFLATYKAAYTVGGDFYDVFWVGPDQLAVFIGDISGKGVAAALLMARISGELRVAALAHVDPVSVFTIMNKAVINRGQPELFFTAIYFTLDVKSGEVWLATAGQPPPYVCHGDGSVEAITGGASGAVGMLDDPQFSATQLFLAYGDSLVLYTDGVVEAAALDGSLYGDERLAACLRKAGPRPKDISEQILHSVSQHTLTAPANDDLTIFICHRASGGPRYAATDEPPPKTVRFTGRRSDPRAG
jgi:serine phosphatase RsbU (regulator of sigma subunit)/pSer/pThr/pTyr-binding forkhead associated (FHA) protein